MRVANCAEWAARLLFHEDAVATGLRLWHLPQAFCAVSVEVSVSRSCALLVASCGSWHSAQVRPGGSVVVSGFVPTSAKPPRPTNCVIAPHTLWQLTWQDPAAPSQFGIWP